MKLDGKKDIQSVKLARLILRSELKTHILPSPKGNIEGPKTNTHRDHRHIYPRVYAIGKNCVQNFLPAYKY